MTAYVMRISDWSSDVCSSDLGRRAQPPSADPGLLRLRLAMTGRVVDPFFPLPRTKRSAFSRFPGPRVEHGAGSAKRRSGAHYSACTVASRVARRWAPHLRDARSVRVSGEEASSLPILRRIRAESESATRRDGGGQKG